MSNYRHAVLPAIGIAALVALVTAPAAQAFRGRGAAFAVGAAAGSNSASSTVVYAAPPPPPPPAAAPAPAAAPPAAAAAGEPLALGVVVASLPSGCTATPVGGINYYYCGGNFYQAVFEGSTLKYITTKPQ